MHFKNFKHFKLDNKVVISQQNMLPIISELKEHSCIKKGRVNSNFKVE